LQDYRPGSVITAVMQLAASRPCHEAAVCRAGRSITSLTREDEQMKIQLTIHLSASLFASSLILAQSLFGQGSLEQQFEALAEKAAEKNFSGIVVAEKGGEIFASQSFGFADAKDETPIDSDTLFEIGSVTKPFTALAVLILERKGKLSLEDSISQHLPNVPDNCRGITIRHLLQHTSGIPGTNYGPPSKEVAVVTKAYLRGGPKKKPGTRFEYWNQGYALLAAIIAKNTNQSYQDAIQELVLRPAGMSSSCFTGDEPPNGLSVSTGKSTTGANRSALDHPYGDFYGLQYQGMGGLVSNANDMVKFVSALRKSKANLDNMLQPGPDGSYGIGWRIEKRNDASQRIFHSGSVRGFLTAVSWYPEQKASIIVLANSDDKAGFYFVESNCRQAFETTIIPLPEDQKFDDDFRASVVGKYTFQSRVVTISQVGDGLKMIIDWGGPKTFGKLAKSKSAAGLRFLDGSGEEISVSLDNQTGNSFQSLNIMNNKYIRRKQE
jgi:CubicO group peptidase (beta-lactamase class C family)